MATLKKPKITRVKRDYPEFRDRLRDVLADRDITQTKAAEMVGMDIRTFNHVVAGPTHPDLMLIKDIGSKFKVNLNYLFGLSSSVNSSPNDFDFTNYEVVDAYEIEEGTQVNSPHDIMALPKYMIDRFGPIYTCHVANSELDIVSGAINFRGYFKYTDEVSAKGVYHTEINGRSYFRWMKRNEWGGLMVATDVLLSDQYEVKPEEIVIKGRLVRKCTDFM